MNRLTKKHGWLKLKDECEVEIPYTRRNNEGFKMNGTKQRHTPEWKMECY